MNFSMELVQPSLLASLAWQGSSPKLQQREPLVPEDGDMLIFPSMDVQGDQGGVRELNPQPVLAVVWSTADLPLCHRAAS